MSQFGGFRVEKPVKNLESLPHQEIDTAETEEEQRYAIKMAVASFNHGQKVVFNAMVGEILTGVTAEDPFAPARENCTAARKSRGFFFDAPGGTGKHSSCVLFSLYSHYEVGK